MGTITRTFANNLIERAGPVRPNANSLIINGDMSVAQRGTSVNNTDGSPYLIDRYRNQAVYGSTAPTATIAISQSATVPSGQGFVKSTKYDVTTAQGSLTTDTGYALEQRIEGQNIQLIKKGTSNAEKLTLAFWVRSNKTGTYVVELADTDNSRQCSQSYTISSADTWEKKVLNYPADTTGAFTNDNGASLKVRIWVAAGATYTNGTLATTWASTSAGNSAVGQVNLVDSTSNEWYITGIQLEVGEYTSSTLPPFQHESFGDNLDRCQRYFQNLAEGTEKPFANGFFWEAQEFMAHASLKGTMRAEPTLEYVTSSGYYAVLRNGAADALSALTISGSSSRSYIRYHLASGQGLASDTKNRPGQLMTQNASSKIGVTAEL